jgi:hypothetical protein
MSDNTILTGVNASRIHQAIIAKLVYGLTNLYLKVRTGGVKKDSVKLLSLMRDYEVPEGFIYDYKLGIWYKYTLSTGETAQQSAWCDAIQADLNGFLNF